MLYGHPHWGAKILEIESYSIYLDYNLEDFMKKRLLFLLLLCLVTTAFASQIDFLNCNGEWCVYIDTSEDFNIYSWSGTPLAYIDEDSNIYGFNGKYLGWLEGQIMYDVDGEPFACTANAYNGYAPYKPYKSYQKYAPYKSYKQYAKYRPYKKS